MKYGIVLAENSVNGELSEDSKERIRASVSLLKSKILDSLILSGGVRKRPGYKEFIGNYESFAKMMEEHAIELGANKDKLILEELSEDTFGQLVFLRYGVLEPRKIISSVIITHDYHAHRVMKFSEIIFGDEFKISYSFISSKNKHKRKGVEPFTKTFRGVNLEDKEEILKTLFTKHPQYNHAPDFYREELNKMIIKNSMKINYGKQLIDNKDIEKVVEVLKGDFLTTGPNVKNFEENFAKCVGAKYSVAVSSGTAALHLACLALRLKKGEELITTPMTFAASSNCALYCGANPIFVDVKENGLIDEDKIKDKITSKTRIIIPVHYSGLPCDMEKIKKIAKQHNLAIIEDACHALGAKYNKSNIGSCEYSDMAVFSFHPVKHITTGEGGMVTTNNKKIYSNLLQLRNHGIEKKEDWKQDMSELGYNYRITDFQCALGENQLKKIKDFVQRRRKIAEKYEMHLKKIPEIKIMKESVNKFNSYHLYVIKLQNPEIRKKLYSFLRENNIFCQVHYSPVYWHSYYKKLGFKKGLCPIAEDFYGKILSIPMYPGLKEEEQEQVIKKIKEFFKK